tara:strand:+ start:116 stop:1126 length:1011 start_codon:yes stop_codon:yes gene_type:complete
MKGLLMINLGSPDSTSAKDVKTYLDEFLMDERVIEYNYLLRWLLVKGIILNTRPKKSAAAYKKIWWKEGSPLIVLSKNLFNKVQKKIEIPVSLAMRYGSISIKNGISELVEKGVNEIIVLPLYPHYAMSSYETVVEKVKSECKALFPNLKKKIIPPFYDNTEYIDLMSQNIKKNIKGIKYDHILFSYHGIPESHIKISDITNNHCLKVTDCCNKVSPAHSKCYRHQVFTTTELIVKKLGIKKDKYSNSFQSRLPLQPWLKPYTDYELKRLAESGKKRLIIITPAFVTDCLETLEEIAMEGKEEFLEAGGKSYHYVPCLNDDSKWADVISNWVKEKV